MPSEVFTIQLCKPSSSDFVNHQERDGCQLSQGSVRLQHFFRGNHHPEKTGADPRSLRFRDFQKASAGEQMLHKAPC